MKKLFKIIGIATLLFVSSLAGDVKNEALNKASPVPPPPTELVPNMSYKKWDIKYSQGAGAHPKPLSVGYYIDFPTSPNVLGYIMQDASGYIPVSTPTEAVTIEASIEIIASPDAIFDFHTNPDNTGNMPSAIRFYVESAWSNDNYVRWWATGNNCLVLANGVYTYTVTIDPSQWSDTWGHRGDSSAEAIAGFYKAFANPIRYGFTCGGGSFYGHGGWLLAGSAKLNVYNIQFRTVSIP